MRRAAQVLCKAGGSAAARVGSSPALAFGARPLGVAFARGMAQETRPGLAPPPAKNVDHEHATGLELRELQAAAEGKDFFDHYDFLQAPNGTEEKPVEVKSSMPYRIVGATDPDDDCIVHWGRVERGGPPVKIGYEWFVHKSVDHLS